MKTNIRVNNTTHELSIGLAPNAAGRSPRRARLARHEEIKDDPHALNIQKTLKKYDDLHCDIVESNCICGSAALSWSTGGAQPSEGRLPVRDNAHELRVSDLDVIWWRRVGFPQSIPPTITEPAQIDLIDNDCRAALVGVLLNEFQGTWINHPANTQLAQNTLAQLRAAKSTGFRIPRTLVSQNPTSIREFCEGLDYQVVVKSISGTQKAPLLTTKITPKHLLCDDSISLCPAIYQEYIPGDLHVRAQCFGYAIYSVTLKSEALDWRPNLNIPCEVVQLDDEVQGRLRTVLKILGLKMGVVDLKFTPEGDLVWFEINPQGQFLFVQGLAPIDLASAFADFLYNEAAVAAKRL